jgi:3-methylcrotonyl-CoA carboxylase beta subunit
MPATTMFAAARIALKRKRLSPHRCRRAIATHTHSHHANQISILRSNVDTSSAEFKDNKAAMDDVIAKMKDLRDTIAQGGSQKAREKHVARGKMLPREYVV